MTTVVYDVEYMGSVALARSTVLSGLGTLQRPLLDLYLTYVPPPSSKSSAVYVRQLPQRRLTLTERGIIVSAMDAVPASHADNDTFYAMPSIVFWEVVRFGAVRTGDKYRGAFEPVGDELNSGVDNLYVGLDKQNTHLVTKVKQHPVILVCVLRRSTAAKQLDLHAFACDSAQLALNIANNLQLLYACYNEGVRGGGGGSVSALQVTSTSSSNSDVSQRELSDVTSQRHQQQLLQSGYPPEQLQQRSSRPGHTVDTSRDDLSDCFVLTQDDVRGDAASRQADKQRRHGGVDDMAAAPASSGQVRRPVALSRSTTSVRQADTRAELLMPIFSAADSSDASTWLDDAAETRRPVAKATAADETRLQDTVQRDSGYDFHFELTPSSSASSSLSHQEQQQQQQQQPAVSSRPVALVQPHKVTGVRVMPEELNVSLMSRSQGKQAKSTGGSSQQQVTPSETAQQDTSLPRNKEERRTPPATSLRDQLKATGSLTRDKPVVAAAKPSNVNRDKASTSAPPAVEKQTASETSDQPSSSSAASSALSSKDKEIASVIGNMKLNSDYSQNTLSAHGTNFEKCLGYFP